MEAASVEGTTPVKRRAVPWLFSVTLFASAFLMFFVQPMFAKMALPKLGGSSAVWSLALVFFQTLLLLGYSYAFLLVRWLDLRLGLAVHLIVSAAAFVSLPIAIPAGWEAPPEQGQASWLLALFGVAVGLPFFALSANAPLLQAWFARAGQARSGDPYFLYVASNTGSLAALIAYPFLFEPFIGLGSQGRVWAMVFLVLVCLIALCGLQALRSRAKLQVPAGAEAANPGRVSWNTRLAWIAYAALPTGLLVAATAHITLDVMSAPFLWVLPLAVYLLTFIIAFARRPVIPHGFVMARVGLYGAGFAIMAALPLGFVYTLSVNLVLCFLLMLGCHGELAARRPSASRLTEFYFFVSLGGVLGGIFSSLVAPVIFSDIYEYPLLVIGAIAALGLAGRGRAALTRAVWAGLLAAPLLVLLYYAQLQLDGWAGKALLLMWAALIFAWLGLCRNETLAMVPLLAMLSVSYVFQGNGNEVLARTRSFYGVLTVGQLQDGRVHQLVHGNTLHGAQTVRLKDGSPKSGRPTPEGYYFPNGPFGSAIGHVRDSRANPAGSLGEVAVVGLGTGGLLCYAKPGEHWRFFELDPQVAAIARDDRYFTFLRDCGPSEVTIGDGRLQIARVPGESYDLIILDAFSSDAIPAHLLTTEAIELYLSKLKPNGAMLVHTSNRFMDLSGVVLAAARQLGVDTWYSVPNPAAWMKGATQGDSFSTLVVLTKSADAIPGFATDARWRRGHDAGITPWTDDYANIPGAIWRMYRFGLSGPPAVTR